MVLNKSPLNQDQFLRVAVANKSLQFLYAIPKSQTKTETNIIVMGFCEEFDYQNNNLLSEFQTPNLENKYARILEHTTNSLNFKKINFDQHFCYWKNQIFVGDLLDLLAHLDVNIPEHWNNLVEFYSGGMYDPLKITQFNLGSWTKDLIEKKFKKDYRELFINDDGFGKSHIK